MAGDHRPFDTKRFDERDKIADDGRRIVARVGLVRLAVPSLIEREDAVAFAQARPHHDPDLRIRRDAVQ